MKNHQLTFLNMPGWFPFWYVLSMNLSCHDCSARLSCASANRPYVRTCWMELSPCSEFLEDQLHEVSLISSANYSDARIVIFFLLREIEINFKFWFHRNLPLIHRLLHSCLVHDFFFSLLYQMRVREATYMSLFNLILIIFLSDLKWN